MPNHVYTRMTVNGELEDVHEFFMTHMTEDKGGDSALDFNTFIPMPEELKGTRAPSDLPPTASKALIDKYGADNWYDWSISNWGTKWNSYDNYLDHDTNSVSFNTAWSLPDPILAKMAEMYPELSFHLEVVEEGGFFAGTIDIESGVVNENLTDDNETWKRYAEEFMGWEFDEEDE